MLAGEVGGPSRLSEHSRQSARRVPATGQAVSAGSSHRRRIQLATRNQQLKSTNEAWVPITAAVSHQA